MTTRHLILAAALTLATTACGAAPGGETGESTTTSETAQGLKFTVQTETELAGTFADGVVTLSFSSKAISDGVFQARVSTGERTFEYTYNTKTAELEYTSGHVAFNAEEVAAIQAFDIAFGVVRNAKESEEYTKPESTMISLLTLATESQPGEVVPVIVKVITRSITNIGCSNTCRTLYGSSECGKGGNTYYKQTGINSPNCKGRCGGGCGDARSNGSTRWTMDCAEHDYHVGPLNDCADDATGGTGIRCGYTSSEFCATNCSCQPTGDSCY
jgi:hypothetical protein